MSERRTAAVHRARPRPEPEGGRGDGARLLPRLRAVLRGNPLLHAAELGSTPIAVFRDARTNTSEHTLANHLGEHHTTESLSRD